MFKLPDYKALAVTLKNKVIAGVKGDKILRLILFGAVIMLAAWGADHIHWKHIPTQYETAVAQFKIERATLLSRYDSVNKQVAVLQKDVVVKGQQADSLVKENAALRSRVSVSQKKLDEQLKVIKVSLPDTCKVAIQVAEGYKANVDSLQTALVKADTTEILRKKQIFDLTQTNTLLKTQSDSLKVALTRVPIAKPEKFLGFIPLPSRKTSFVVGLATGAVSVVGIIAATH